MKLIKDSDSVLVVLFWLIVILLVSCLAGGLTDSSASNDKITIIPFLEIIKRKKLLSSSY
jgi:hypothetical protein